MLKKTIITLVSLFTVFAILGLLIGTFISGGLVWHVETKIAISIAVTAATFMTTAIITD